MLRIGDFGLGYIGERIARPVIGTLYFAGILGLSEPLPALIDEEKWKI
jgi:hypothetical protein